MPVTMISLPRSLASGAESSDGVAATWAIALVDNNDATRAAEAAANLPFATPVLPFYFVDNYLQPPTVSTMLYDIQYTLRLIVDFKNLLQSQFVIGDGRGNVRKAANGAVSTNIGKGRIDR
ncbi:MAG: hypothetical protein V4564_24575 [Pseudomonadota bacterium]